MKSILTNIRSNFMKDRRFEVSNSRKFILVIGLTGQGKSSFINFMTNTNLCKVSGGASSCTNEYQMVESCYYNKILYFIDTPGLDDANGDKKNIEEIIKFRNTVPRINAIIFCQSIAENRFSQSIKDLFSLMTQLYNDPNLFSHFIIVRTKSDRQSRDFETNKKNCENSIYNKLKEFSLIKNEKTISEYFIDSKYQDEFSLKAKEDILGKLEKMDPIFLGVNVEIIEHVEIYDSSKNRYIIKESKKYEYTDYDGKKKNSVELENEVLDLNGIKDVKVDKNDTNTSWGICCCKLWKIVYKIYHINYRNEEIEAISPIESWQQNRNEDKSDIIRKDEKKRIGL